MIAATAAIVGIGCWHRRARQTNLQHSHSELLPLFTFSRRLLLLAYVSQISRPVEASQALVSSSRLTIPSLSDGGRCCGQTSKMWSTVCSGGTTFTDRGVIEAPLQHGRAEPAYTRAKAVEGCPLLSRQVEARDAVWIADEVVQSRRRSCQPIVFPAGPEPGLLRHAWGRQIADMMGLLGEGAT